MQQRKQRNPVDIVQHEKNRLWRITSSYLRGNALFQVRLGQQRRSCWLRRPTTDAPTSSWGRVTTVCRDELRLATTQNLCWWFKPFLLLLSIAFFSQGRAAIHLFEMWAGVGTCVYAPYLGWHKRVSVLWILASFLKITSLTVQLTRSSNCDASAFVAKTERRMQLLMLDVICLWAIILE